MRLTRRGALTGVAATAAVAAGGGLVEYDVLPGRPALHRLLHLNGGAGRIPDVATGPVVSGRLPSRLVEADPEFQVAYPPGTQPGERLPVVVVLHPAGSSAADVFTTLGLPQFLAASRHRLALAAVDGGARGYWQDQGTGDAGALVLEEFLAALADRGLDVGRPSWLGWSMGGYGALRLASLLLADRRPVGRVLAVSPALWTSWSDTGDGVFTGRDQYDAAMGLIGTQVLVARPPVPVRVDCGEGDPFYRQVRALADHTGVETHWAPGAHDAAYWTRELPGQLDWLARSDR